MNSCSLPPFVPYFKGVLLGAFFMMAIHQTWQTINMYLYQPVNSVASFEPMLQPPWITICPVPGLNFTQLVTLTKVTADSQWWQNWGNQAGSMMSILMFLSNLHTKQHADPGNADWLPMREFLWNVTLPFWEIVGACQVQWNGVDYFCNPPQPKRSGQQQSPLFLPIPQYSWQKQQLEESGWRMLTSVIGGIGPVTCATLELNGLPPASTLETGLAVEENLIELHFVWPSLESTFNPALDEQQAKNKTSIRSLLATLLDCGWPQVKIFTHDRGQYIRKFSSTSAFQNAMAVELMESLTLDYSLEIYKDLSKKLHPCIVEEDVNNLNAQSIKLENNDCDECLERTNIFPCTEPTMGRPGHNLRTPTGSRTCTTDDDLYKYTRVATKLTSIDPNSLPEGWAKTLAECCPKLCIRKEHILTTAHKGVYPSYQKKRQLERFVEGEDTQSPDELISRVVIRLGKNVAKVNREEYAYGFNDLIGEIGGIWGLFLGASLLSIGDLATALIRFLLERRHQEKEQTP